MKDYYQVLSVPRDATVGQIKRAYRKRIKACHPDVNPSPQSIEWTRELNEAYGVLGNLSARATYDAERGGPDAFRQGADFSGKSAKAAHSEDESRRAGPGESKAQAEWVPPTGGLLILSCEHCARTDPTLRFCVTWRVFSFIFHAWQAPSINLLCSRCRVKESILANAITLVCGWWSLAGLRCTRAALLKNSCGGELPVRDNVELLHALGNQYFHRARHREAFETMLAAYQLHPDPQIGAMLDHWSAQAGPARRKTFWQRFRGAELHPVCYHVLAAAAAILALVYCLAARSPW